MNKELETVNKTLINLESLKNSIDVNLDGVIRGLQIKQTELLIKQEKEEKQEDTSGELLGGTTHNFDELKWRVTLKNIERADIGFCTILAEQLRHELNKKEGVFEEGDSVTIEIGYINDVPYKKIWSCSDDD